MDRRRVVPMDDDAVGALDCGDLDLWALDRAQVHTGLDPALEEDVIDGIGGAHHNVGAGDRLFRVRYRSDVDAEQRAHARGEGLPVFRVGAETTDRPDVAHGAGGHELRTRLPAG